MGSSVEGAKVIDLKDCVDSSERHAACACVNLSGRFPDPLLKVHILVVWKLPLSPKKLRGWLGTTIFLELKNRSQPQKEETKRKTKAILGPNLRKPPGPPRL